MSGIVIELKDSIVRLQKAYELRVAESVRMSVQCDSSLNISGKNATLYMCLDDAGDFLFVMTRYS